MSFFPSIISSKDKTKTYQSKHVQSLKSISSPWPSVSIYSNFILSFSFLQLRFVTQAYTAIQIDMASHYFLCFLFFLVSSAIACDRCVHQAKVAHFASSAPLSSGACGYGPMALGFNKGALAGAVPSLFKNGAGCGSCFQIRCKDKALCRSNGTRVFLSDQNHNTQVDFVLSSSAFTAMGVRGKGQQLLNKGIVDVEYKRVPCDVGKNNLVIHVEHSSQKPHYLAIKFLNQGGQTEILGVDIAQVHSRAWVSMNRVFGAVWHTSKVPAGALQMRLKITAGFDVKWFYIKSGLPAEWQAKGVYDTKVQITDIAQETCSPCDNGNWK